MKRKNEAHELVIESLIEALLQLMEKKPLSEINITELCARAGVSRVSFYRNFKSMQDILVFQLSKSTNIWWAEFSKKEHDEFYQTFWAELLEQYRMNERLVNLIYKNNVSHLLKEHIFNCCGLNSKLDDNESYSRAVLAGAIYGLVDEWIKRGMQDFPKDFSIKKIAREMADFK
jgi:AcrR family transcriptional regulator